MADDPLQPFLDRLAAVPFVRTVSVDRHAREQPPRMEARLRVRTPSETFTFTAQCRKSYLDRPFVNATLAAAKANLSRRHMLLARYIPRPTGERLMEVGINFVDLAGNMHLALGSNYHHSVLGRREPARGGKERQASPAIVQLLFTVAAYPEATAWPVRKLAEAAGVSKSATAEGRSRLLEWGTLVKREDSYLFADRQRLEERLLPGYAASLRPRLQLGRYRFPDQSPEEFLIRARRVLGEANIRFALTGGPAADALQHFYRGLEVPFFLTRMSPTAQQALRLLPDQEGPVTVLRAFGKAAFWRLVEGIHVAHPWLIYAELMYSSDPRAHEAAEHLRKEFLEQ